MNKPMSTYERKMKDAKFKKAYQSSYKELLFSELMISIMEEDDKSIRELAKEAHISASVIQDLRTGKQQDIKVSNLIKLARVFGYALILQKGKEQLTLEEKMRNHKKHISVFSAA